MNKEFSDFVEGVSTIITDIFNEKGEIPPTWLFTDGYKLFIEITPYNNVEEKNLADTSMRLIFNQLKIKRYIYICEAWIAKRKREDVKNFLEGPPPSERPDREEVVMLSGQDVLGDAVFAYTLIHRNSLSKLAMIKEFKLDYSTTSLQGRFVNMFGEKEEIRPNDNTSTN